MTATHAAAVAVGSALATLALAPPTMRLLRHHDVLDVPNHRSSHELPTLRGGGVAVLAAVLLVSAAAQLLGLRVPWAAVGACVALSVLGLAADLTDLGALPRFVGQALVGAGLGSLLGDHVTALVGAVAVPVVVNAVNFMDGIDGITGMTMAAWAVVVLVGGEVAAGRLLAALVLGGALGFLPWNVPRARMFLGDSGSYLFGGLVAATFLVELSGGGRPVVVAAALLPYLFDTGSTLARRAARGAPLAQPHREHLYQLLSRRPGWTHVRVSALVAAVTLVSGSLALLLVRQNGAP